jgi:HEPN domain-containing protein
MEKIELIRYWLDSAGMDYRTMEKLYQTEEYPWSLFIGQLVIEKTLKAVYTQNVDNDVPRIHDLSRLAISAKIELSQSDLDNLDVLSSFNMNTRYPDAKLSFYQTCTQEYTTVYIGIIKDIYKWLLSLVKTN